MARAHWCRRDNVIRSIESAATTRTVDHGDGVSHPRRARPVTRTQVRSLMLRRRSEPASVSEGDAVPHLLVWARSSASCSRSYFGSRRKCVRRAEVPVREHVRLVKPKSSTARTPPPLHMGFFTAPRRLAASAARRQSSATVNRLAAPAARIGRARRVHERGMGSARYGVATVDHCGRNRIPRMPTRSAARLPIWLGVLRRGSSKPPHGRRARLGASVSWLLRLQLTPGRGIEQNRSG
jgi:hypothetical protein